MRNRGLFFYTYENNEQEYNEITNLILELSKLSKMTDEQLTEKGYIKKESQYSS